ncbi:chloroplastic group IIA intron splicing facilitator CRS1, chloroplastic-like isoform X2 [Vicia villosa]|uniref:chloroplastic group IIA intron splicing facilitator CRS1, chloroplastic-like isoform X2 n=1 Tax=Vicia villosa TaxID=3911 RepID=UPI00273CA093|nr:chloroplastic group IIA intron splicing facilitator CRS1, chloroplastic-like isoform X2 [Vicia villosa]
MLFLNYSSYSVVHISSSSFSSNPKNNLNHHKPTSLSISNNNSHSHDDDVSIKFKAPTPPWMNSPLLLQPKDLPNPNLQKRDHSDKSLTGKQVKGKKALKKIAHKVERLHSTETQMGSKKVENFGACLESLMENEEVVTKGRMPWEKDEKIDFLKVKKEKIVTSADLALDKVLLQRLRGEAAKMRIWVKVKKAGVTQDVVKEIKRTWRTNELAMVKFDIPLCQNMDRAREIVETKTGGLVVWSKKDALVVYRGCDYQLTSKGSPKIHTGYIPSQRKNSYETSEVKSSTKADHYLVESDQTRSEILSGNVDHKDSQSIDIHDMNYQPTNRSLYERECDRLLDGLGPRFIDWWMNTPLPVDADLLPEVVPGFKPPFRLCPPHARVKLTDGELTYFRRVSHPLPTHFVLGRNKGLQGLAAAILKLWHKSHIVKIAIKYGVQNTDNETMANELKRLTGGVLLLRNKFYILLYRGKDFLPRRVADLVKRRELEFKSCQVYEEDARLKAIQAFSSIEEFQLPQETSTSGSLTEYMEIRNKHESIKEVDVDINVPLEAEIYRLEKELREQQRKAFILNKKIERSSIELSKINAAWKPSGEDIDLEIMTDEERECFRKMGLKMRSCLVLGRRGIFDGVLEGLHQHWKFREVAKVITMQRLLSRVIYTAQFIERESGGILVSVDKLKEGHAIIIYRGKNYSRPKEKIAKNLLTKRKALQRSLEMQRIGSLKFFAHQREKTISDLKLKLETLKQGKEIEVREFEN